MALPVVDYIADYADYDSDNDDSSDDVVVVNTMGKSVPLEWYNVEDHIGYNVEGKKIDKLAREDQMSLLINRNRDCFTEASEFRQCLLQNRRNAGCCSLHLPIKSLCRLWQCYFLSHRLFAAALVISSHEAWPIYFHHSLKNKQKVRIVTLSSLKCYMNVKIIRLSKM